MMNDERKTVDGGESLDENGAGGRRGTESAHRTSLTTRLRPLVFTMDRQEYVVEVAQVREIVRPAGLIRLGGAREHVLGLIKRRGHIVPVVDLRKRLGVGLQPFGVSTCAIIAKLQAGPVGLLVDSVS